MEITTVTIMKIYFYFHFTKPKIAFKKRII